MKTFKIALVALFFAGLFSSCSVSNMAMREPNSHVEFQKSDFTFSNQVKGTATQTKIIGIDITRLLVKETGMVGNNPKPSLAASIPVIGSAIVDPTQGYALYNLLSTNKDYDVVFYPQFTTKVEKPVGLGFLYKITTVEVKAKLGKIK